MITFIGTGPMGQAMVRALVKAGHEVTVWNRTPSKAEGLGATVAPTVADALAASDVVFLSLTDYQVMFDLLDGQAVDGKTIINLSSDTPATTRRAAEWVAQQGATLIVGGVMVPEELVATDSSYVFYSGPEDVVRQYESVLAVIGRVDFVGEDPALAQLFYQAQLDHLPDVAGRVPARDRAGGFGRPRARRFSAVCHRDIRQPVVLPAGGRRKHCQRPTSGRRAPTSS